MSQQFKSRFNELAFIRLERLARILVTDINLLQTPEVWAHAHKRFEEALDEWLPLNPKHDRRPRL